MCNDTQALDTRPQLAENEAAGISHNVGLFYVAFVEDTIRMKYNTVYCHPTLDDLFVIVIVVDRVSH